METIKLRVKDRGSDIFFGRGWNRILPELCSERNTFIITDSNVNSLYKDSFPNYPVMVVEPGEHSKSLQFTEDLIARLAELGADRSSLILGIGGGMVSDLAGFVASLFMRGVDCGFVSTTLLSQVDAGIGGKNGVNVNGIKNIAGTFSQPKFVISDPVFLSTLSRDQYRSGLGEMVKYGLIGSKGLFIRLEERFSNDKLAVNKNVEDLIPECIKMKCAIVEMDEKEEGVRRLLNLGHTAGHAIETVTGLPHGVAVAHGIVFSASVSEEMGYLDKIDRERISRLLNQMNILPSFKVEKERIKDLILSDKKRAGNEISFVFLKGIGKAVVEKVPLKDVARWLNKREY